ncbi:helix-turn-helix domain-containing protein [Nonomuraea sp. NPDC052129]|uniref:helix-turn-helix domain-containing protein n=1 Tax=Nonomuraea sp. NPDC052129 TaxID=3154651 RepID=UPI00342C3A43
MDVRTLPEALKAIMEERNWTQIQLAQELGVSQAWISRVCRGVADTSLTRAKQLLARVGWEMRFSPSVEEPVERREFLAAAASVMFVPSAVSSNPYLDPDYVRALADSLARGRYELGGVPIAARALGHVKQITHIPMKTVGIELQGAASDLMYQAGIALYDAGRLAQAEHAGMTALDLAHHAQNFPAQARAYDALSRVSLYRDDPMRAVQYAQRGLRIPGLPSSRQSSLHMRLGRALAGIKGSQKDARTALDRALDARGLSAFAEATLGGDVAIGLSQLGQFNQAEQLLGNAAEAMGQWSLLFQAQYLGRLAQTAIQANKPTLAVHHIYGLTRALPFISSARVNNQAKDIIQSSAKWDRIPDVRVSRERLYAMLSPEHPPS